MSISNICYLIYNQNNKILKCAGVKDSLWFEIFISPTVLGLLGGIKLVVLFLKTTGDLDTNAGYPPGDNKENLEPFGGIDDGLDGDYIKY